MKRTPLKRKGKLNKRRKGNITKLKDKLMELTKQYVRLRDNYTDQRSGERVEGSNCHVSHVIPVSHGNALAFDPINMKILSYHNHINWWHKNPIEAVAWFEQKFPDRFRYLMNHKNDIVKWKEWDYEAKIEEMKNKIASLSGVADGEGEKEI